MLTVVSPSTSKHAVNHAVSVAQTPHLSLESVNSFGILSPDPKLESLARYLRLRDAIHLGHLTLLKTKLLG